MTFILLYLLLAAALARLVTLPHLTTSNQVRMESTTYLERHIMT